MIKKQECIIKCRNATRLMFKWSKASCTRTSCTHTHTHTHTHTRTHTRTHFLNLTVQFFFRFWNQSRGRVIYTPTHSSQAVSQAVSQASSQAVSQAGQTGREAGQAGRPGRQVRKAGRQEGRHSPTTQPTASCYRCAGFFQIWIVGYPVPT